MKFLDLGERLDICKVRYAARAILLWASHMAFDNGVYDFCVNLGGFFNGDLVIDKDWAVDNVEKIARQIAYGDNLLSKFIDHTGPSARVTFVSEYSKAILHIFFRRDLNWIRLKDVTWTTANKKQEEAKEHFLEFFEDCYEGTLWKIEECLPAVHRVPKPLKDVESTDPVNHPSHYISNGIEVIDVIEAFTKDCTGMEAVCVANALKYICRWKHKNGIEDLKKARWYLDRLIEGKEGE